MVTFLNPNHRENVLTPVRGNDPHHCRTTLAKTEGCSGTMKGWRTRRQHVSITVKHGAVRCTGENVAESTSDRDKPTLQWDLSARLSDDGRARRKTLQGTRTPHGQPKGSNWYGRCPLPPKSRTQEKWGINPISETLATLQSHTMGSPTAMKPDGRSELENRNLQTLGN